MNMHSLANARQTIGYMEKSGANLSQSLKRLSSGIKVDGASDAGGLAVSTKMDSVITRTRTLGANVQNGMSFLESQDAAQSKLGAILTRMSELRVRYDDPTINTSDGANFNREFKELQDDVRTLAQKKFNGISLFSSGSDADSKLVIGANSANPSNVREVTRNQFFNSLLDTQSSGGPVGGSATRQVNFGSFTDRSVPPTGGTASVLPGNIVNGLQGTALAQVINGVTGTTPVQTVKGVATGTTTDLTINAQQGTFTKNDVNGAQGTTPDFTLSGTAGTGTGATAPVTTTGGTSPSELWKKNFTGGTNGFDKMSPVFDSNGDIFVGKHEDNKIFQLKASDGSTVRTYDLRDPLTGDPTAIPPIPPTDVKNMSWKVAVADTSGDGNTDTLYAANGDGKQLIAFDTSNGNVKAGWPQTLGGAGDAWAITETPPFVHSNGNVYVMSNGDSGFAGSGKIYCFQPDGSVPTSWNPPAGGDDINGEFTGGFAEASDGTLILTGKGSTFNHISVQAFDADTGGSLPGTSSWSVTHGTIGAVNGPPVIVGNSVVVNSDSTKTMAIDINTGAVTELRNNSGTPGGGPVVGKSDGTDAVFVATSSGFAAIAAVGGATLWTRGGFDAETCTPAYDSTKNRLYVTDDNTGEVIALRTAADGGNAAGTVAWRIATGNPSLSSPAVDSSGNIYVGNNNGDFIAISPPGMTLPAVDVGTGYTVAPPLSDVTLTQTSAGPDVTGTLAVASVTLNGDTSLNVTFSGTATGAGTFDVKVASSTITPPAAVSPVGSGYLTTETAPLVRVLAQGIGDKSATLKNGLVALIDGNTAPPAGGGTITDSSGAGNDGTVSAGQEPAHETTERRSGAGAYTFNGTADKIDLGDLNTELSGQDKLTISAWVYHTESGDDRIVCKSPDMNVANHIFSLGISTGDNVRMRVGTNTTPATSMDGGNIPLNEWTHVAMTYDGANVKSYINGSLDSTHALTGNIKSSTPGNNVYIGNVNNTDDRHFKGNLDDVGIWNRALTASDIAEIAGPGDLTATASIITTGTDAGKLTVTPTSTSTLATIGPFTVEVDDGVMRNPADFTTTLATTNKYDAPSDTVGSTPTVTFSGTDKGNLAATATVRADGQLDIKFTTGSPSGTGNFTMTVDPGTFHLDDPPPQGSGYVSGETPAFTITGTDKGTTGLAGTATVITTGPDAGKLTVDLSGVQPTGTGNLTLSIADGFKAPAALTGIGKDYVFGPPAEANPTVTVTGADKGTLITGTATIQSDGKLNVTFPTNQFPTGPGDLTVTIAPGIMQSPTNIPIIGTGYDATETPTFTITDGDTTDTTPLPATTTGNATNNGNGTLSVDLSGIVPNGTGTGDLILTVNPGTVRAPANLTGIGSGYDAGPPQEANPNIIISGTDRGSLTANAAIITSGADKGKLGITFGGTPTGTGDITLTIDDGVGRLSDFTVPGSGYAPGETPVVTIAGGSGSSGTATALVDGTGTLNVDLSAVRTNDLGTRTVQIANGATLQTPADVTGIGDFHDPAGPPPTVNLSGAPSGPGLTATATVQPDGKVNVSFAGTPTTAGTLNVQVLGASGTGSTGVSSKYLLDIDGDLWDYTVSEFGSFTKLVSDARAQNGAEQNSLGTFWELLSTNVNKLEQAAGRIKDADFAKEMTELSKSQINNRSAAVMLGKQNRITSEALLTLQNLSNML